MKKFLSTFMVLFVTSLIACDGLFENEQGNHDDLIWVGQPNAPQQCGPTTFKSLEDAIQSLNESNIGVFDSTEVSFPVCAACICPTGIIYYAEISASDSIKAKANGWIIIDGEPVTE